MLLIGKPTNPKSIPTTTSFYGLSDLEHSPPSQITWGLGTRPLGDPSTAQSLLKLFQLSNPKPALACLPCLAHSFPQKPQWRLPSSAPPSLPTLCVLSGSLFIALPAGHASCFYCTPVQYSKHCFLHGNHFHVCVPVLPHLIKTNPCTIKTTSQLPNTESSQSFDLEAHSPGALRVYTSPPFSVQVPTSRAATKSITSTKGHSEFSVTQKVITGALA